MSVDGRPEPPPGHYEDFANSDGPWRTPPDDHHDPSKLEVALRPYTDLGNAERVQHLYGPDMRWCGDADEWMVWLGTHWEGDSTETTRRWCATTVRRIKEEIEILVEKARRKAEKNGEDFVEAVARKPITKSVMGHARRSEGTGRLTAMLRETRALAGIPAPVATLDRAQMLLNVENGTIDLRDCTLRPHRRDDLITRVAPVRFDPRAECPLWLKFIDRTFCGDQDLSEFMRRVVGYGLTGSSIEQVLVVMYGAGSNGKSTFAEMLFSLLGPYAQAAPRGLLTETRNDRHPTELARLRGARLVAAMETKEDIKLDEPLVKQITGGDTITARFMRGDFFEFEPTHTMLMATNHKPRIHGTDLGIWRRVRLVPFAATIKDGEKDPHLKQKLRAELPGILNWSLRGCLDWQREGLASPASVSAATKDYREEMDLLGRFLKDSFRLDPTLQLESKTIYSTYREWCRDNGHHPMTATKLGRELSKRGHESFRDSSARWRRGIGLHAVSDQLRGWGGDPQ